jgi:hypothetical protein
MSKRQGDQKPDLSFDDAAYERALRRHDTGKASVDISQLLKALLELQSAFGAHPKRAAHLTREYRDLLVTLGKSSLAAHDYVHTDNSMTLVPSSRLLTLIDALRKAGADA